jgi:hypothetical protein
MGRFARSLELVGQSFRLLMQDKELMVLPLVSGLVTAVVVATFFVGFGLSFALMEHPQPLLALPIFLMYVATYFVGIFFHAAVIAGATERLHGGTPTLGSALSAAARRAGPILLWALIAATVGTLLQMIRGRGHIVERIVASILGAAWSLATFFIVPVLVLEDVSVRESFSRSLNLMRQTWGEAVVGTGGVGLVGFACWVGLGLVVALFVALNLVPVAVTVGVLGGITLLAGFSALGAIYAASLYRYATTGSAGPGFDTATLAQAFERR